MNTHETMMEQIRRLNAEEKVLHEQRRQEAINRIRELRLKQKAKQPCDQPCSS